MFQGSAAQVRSASIKLRRGVEVAIDVQAENKASAICLGLVLEPALHQAILLVFKEGIVCEHITTHDSGERNVDHVHGIKIIHALLEFSPKVAEVLNPVQTSLRKTIFGPEQLHFIADCQAHTMCFQPMSWISCFTSSQSFSSASSSQVICVPRRTLTPASEGTQQAEPEPAASDRANPPSPIARP